MKEVTLLFLTGAAWTDLRKQHIHRWLLISFLLYTVLLRIWKGDLFTLNYLGGALPGVLLLMLTRLTDGQIGKGDGWLILVNGLGMGILNNFCLLAGALALLCVTGGILIGFRKCEKGTKLPFVPFLLAAYLIQNYLPIK